MIESLADAKVDMLIDASNRQWDHGLIDEIFTPEEAELIKQIPSHRLRWWILFFGLSHREGSIFVNRVIGF